MKKTRMAFAAMVMALVLAFTPAAVIADTTTAHSIIEGEEPHLFDQLEAMLGPIRPLVPLTEEARALVLYDLEYLLAMLLDVLPTQNIVERRFGLTLVEYFDIWYQVTNSDADMPSILSIAWPERWEEAPEDDRSIAADYLFTVLFAVANELGGLGHMIPQNRELISQTYLGVAQLVYADEELLLISDEELAELLEMGITAEQVELLIESLINFAQIRYDIYTHPAVQWFYDIDISEFDLSADLSEFMGFMDPDNIVTQIIEEGRIAYVRINSFLGNMLFDAESLFPFFEEVQDFEHLIIDIRSNGGGWANYFNYNVVSRLISEPIVFESYEFFIDNPRTAPIFDGAPPSMLGGIMYGIFPAAEFVSENNMDLFNQADLGLLDYVIVWHTGVWPAEYSHTPFEGEIWLLVDGGSASASDNAATLSIATGFATVVGEPTAGVTGVAYTYAALPNSGILFRIDLGYTVDPRGRSIEEFGVIPQIANAPGMDALETVLATIGNGQAVPVAYALMGQLPIPPMPTGQAITDDLVALRLAANNAGYTVAWDGAYNRVTLTSPGGETTVVYVSQNGVVNVNGTVFVPQAVVSQLFAPAAPAVVEEVVVEEVVVEEVVVEEEIEEEVAEEAPVHTAAELTGAWNWNSIPYYVFNANGTGTMMGTAIDWWTADGVLSICVTPDFCRGNCVAPTEWYYTVEGNSLRLRSTIIESMEFEYTRG